MSWWMRSWVMLHDRTGRLEIDGNLFDDNIALHDRTGRLEIII